MGNTVPVGMVNMRPSEACQAAADHFAAKAQACEASARLSREQADRAEREAAIYRDTEQQWRDSKSAILRLFGEDADACGKGICCLNDGHDGRCEQ